MPGRTPEAAPRQCPSPRAEDQDFSPRRLLCPSTAHRLQACARGGKAMTGQTDIDKSHAGDEVGSPGWWEREPKESRRSRKGEGGTKSTQGTAREAGRRLQLPQWVGGQHAVRGSCQSPSRSRGAQIPPPPTSAQDQAHPCFPGRQRPGCPPCSSSGLPGVAGGAMMGGLGGDADKPGWMGLGAAGRECPLASTRPL